MSWKYNPFTDNFDYYETGGGGGIGNCVISDDGTYLVVTQGTGNASIEDDGTYLLLKDDLGNYLLKVKKTSGDMFISGGVMTDETFDEGVIFKVRKSDGSIFIKGGVMTDEPL